MTTKTIPINKLKIGMYIILDMAWFKHPFLKNQFIISSGNEIRKLKSLGLRFVKVDLARSKIFAPPTPSAAEDTTAEPEREKPSIFRKEAAAWLEKAKPDIIEKEATAKVEPVKPDIAEKEATAKIEPVKPDIAEKEATAKIETVKPDIAEKEATAKIETVKPDIAVVPADLLEVIHDRHLIPAKKALLIRQHSNTMMQRLLEQPTAANIENVKSATADLVDLILRDDETTFYLTNISSYDYNTYVHSVDVGVIAIALAKSVFRRSNGHDLHALGAGFFLHDLGKVHVNLEIINKPGKLSNEEMEEMRQHPSMGFSLLEEAKQATEELKLIVLQHHEKLDGGGYPYGLRGEDIHIYGRICAIADIFNAMTSKRPYKNPMPSFNALKTMRDEMIPQSLQKDLFEKLVLLFKVR